MTARLQRPVELVGGDLLDGLARHLERGVVDQDVDLPELLHRPVDDRPAVGLFLDVARDGDAFPAGGLDHPGGLLRVGLLAQVGDEDVGPLAGEGQRHGPADAAVAAGDDCGLSFELARPFVALLAIVRLRVHLGLEARRVLLLGRMRRLRAFFTRVLWHGASPLWVYRILTIGLIVLWSSLLSIAWLMSSKS